MGTVYLIAKTEMWGHPLANPCQQIDKRPAEKRQHNGVALAIAIVLMPFAAVMSESLASDRNDPHQSPIWIKAGHILCFSAPGTSVPHTIFGTKTCPISLSESVVQPLPSSPLRAHVLGETPKRWSTGMSNQFRWLCQSPDWFIPVAQN